MRKIVKSSTFKIYLTENGKITKEIPIPKECYDYFIKYNTMPDITPYCAPSR